MPEMALTILNVDLSSTSKDSFTIIIASMTVSNSNMCTLIFTEDFPITALLQLVGAVAKKHVERPFYYGSKLTICKNWWFLQFCYK